MSAKFQSNEKMANLNTFCGTHEKLASWVKFSILNNEGLGKRADTVDLWIKVAEVSILPLLTFPGCTY